jgi:HEAT repeat protein
VVRVQAIGVIGFLKIEEAVPALTAATTDPDSQVRRAAVNSLAFSNLKPAADSVMRALSDKEWLVRETAAETLGVMKNGPQAAVALLAVLSDEFWQVRLKAVRSLGKLKVRDAVSGIAANLEHEQANLRKESAAALGEIADPAAAPYLERVQNDSDPEVRKNARWAIQQILLRNPNN